MRTDSSSTARSRRDAARLSDLFHRWQDERDPSAREQLILRFTPLARKLARRYVGANEPIEDLQQVANVGLVLAVDRFDPDRGSAFSSYAVPTILGELRRYFRDHGWAVHVPRTAQERALAVERARKDIAGRDGREPSTGQLAQSLQWPIEDVLGALQAGAAHHAVSLELPRDDEDGEHGVLADRFGEVEPGYELVESRAAVASAMRTIPVKERRVLRMRFIDGMTQSEIGRRVGVSQMQVSRILRAALSRLAERADPAVRATEHRERARG